jgi:hypothetical protein
MRLPTTFWLERLKGRDCSDGRIILKCILGNRFWGVGWINLAEDGCG